MLLGSAGLVHAESQARRWLPDPVLQASIVDRDGTRLGNPTQLVALPGGGFAVVHDFVTIHAFDSVGAARWTYGQHGEGPHEFGFVQDVDVTPMGEVLILDRNLGRVSVIDGRTGRAEVAFRLPWNPSPLNGYGVLPGHGEAQALIIPQSGTDTVLWVAVSDDGRRLGYESMPPEVNCVHHLACEFFTTVTGSRGSAIAFRWSSRLLFLEPNGSVRTIVDGVEEIPFPEVKPYDRTTSWGTLEVTRVDPQAPTAVVDLTADSSHLFVSFSGITDNSGRIVDVYTVADGSYRGSYLFPENVGELAVLSDGRMATLEVEYYPTVHLWELTR